MVKALKERSIFIKAAEAIVISLDDVYFLGVDSAIIDQTRRDIQDIGGDLALELAEAEVPIAGFHEDDESEIAQKRWRFIAELYKTTPREAHERMSEIQSKMIQWMNAESYKRHRKKD